MAFSWEHVVQEVVKNESQINWTSDLLFQVPAYSSYTRLFFHIKGMLYKIHSMEEKRNPCHELPVRSCRSQVEFGAELQRAYLLDTR